MSGIFRTRGVLTAGVSSVVLGAALGLSVPALTGLLLLPIMGFRLRKQSRKRLSRLLSIALFFGIGLASAVGLTGCGSRRGSPGEISDMVVVATSGAVQHGAVVQLSIQ